MIVRPAGTRYILPIQLCGQCTRAVNAPRGVVLRRSRTHSSCPPYRLPPAWHCDSADVWGGNCTPETYRSLSSPRGAICAYRSRSLSCCSVYADYADVTRSFVCRPTYRFHPTLGITIHRSAGAVNIRQHGSSSARQPLYSALRGWRGRIRLRSSRPAQATEAVS